MEVPSTVRREDWAKTIELPSQKVSIFRLVLYGIKASTPSCGSGGGKRGKSDFRGWLGMLSLALFFLGSGQISARSSVVPPECPNVIRSCQLSTLRNRLGSGAEWRVAE